MSGGASRTRHTTATNSRPARRAPRARRLRAQAGDLRRDGRYALHSDTCPPPRQEDGFSVTGRAREVTDPAVRRAVREQVLAERGGTAWPGLDDDALFELGVERCLLMLTQAGETFPRGPTIWRARP
jgi:hypothetical protein